MVDLSLVSPEALHGGHDCCQSVLRGDQPPSLQACHFAQTHTKLFIVWRDALCTCRLAQEDVPQRC